MGKVEMGCYVLVGSKIYNGVWLRWSSTSYLFHSHSSNKEPVNIFHPSSELREHQRPTTSSNNKSSRPPKCLNPQHRQQQLRNYPILQYPSTAYSPIDDTHRPSSPPPQPSLHPTPPMHHLSPPQRKIFFRLTHPIILLHQLQSSRSNLLAKI